MTASWRDHAIITALRANWMNANNGRCRSSGSGNNGFIVTVFCVMVASLAAIRLCMLPAASLKALLVVIVLVAIVLLATVLAIYIRIVIGFVRLAWLRAGNLIRGVKAALPPVGDRTRPPDDVDP